MLACLGKLSWFFSQIKQVYFMNADGNPKPIKLGDALYTLRRGELFDSDGQLLAVRTKSAQMMAVLLSESGRIFSKDEIAREVWPDVIASDESISQCVSEIRKALNDREHMIVRTYPKRGYSINAEFPDVKKRTASRFLPFIASALVLAVIGIAVVFQIGGSDEQLNTAQPNTEPLRDVVAVLPFQSLNSTGDDAYLSIGLAEDLIIQLSEMSAVSVLPSTWSFPLANDVDAPLDVAKSLNARYLVYGRIHHGKKVLQISIQLIDGYEGTSVWAGKYEVAREDLLTYHQAVLGNLTTAMSVALSTRDERLIEVPATSSKQAFNEILKGRVAANEFSNQANLLAEKHFREAVRLAPNYARAYAELAAVYAIRFENAWSVLVEADEQKALYYAQKAIELDPELWLAQYAIGRIYSTISDSDLAAAEQHLRIAMSLKPDNDDARVYFAAVKNFAGQAEEALAIIDSVLATHPAPPHWYFLSHGHALLHLDRHEEAAMAIEKCLEQMPTSPYCLRVQITNYGLMGQLDDAEWAAEEYAMLGHDLTIDLIVRLLLDKHPDHIKRLRHGLSAAGLK